MAPKLACPHCGHYLSKVKNSRVTTRGDAITRRRECLGCRQRFTTTETYRPSTEFRHAYKM